MNFWYIIISYLPFEWANYNFMKNALLAVILITPIFGVVGTMIVNNKMAFFSDSIGHSALTGIAIGIALNIKMPIISLIIFSIIFAIMILLLKNMNKSSTDTIIGVVSSTVIALGIMILSYGGGFSKYTKYLIGDILSVSENDIMLIFIVFLVVLIFWITMYNELLLTSINYSFGKSRGIKNITVETAFVVLTAVIVAISIQWVGIMIINSMLILPAAAARNISNNVKQYHIFALLISVVSGILGLILSFYLGTATGATIIIVAACFFIITILIRNIRA